MGNAATAEVMGKGKVLHKFTSEKSLFLNNMQFVPSLRTNLVSSSLLDIAGFEVNPKAEKIIIIRNGALLVKGIVAGGSLF